MKIISRNNPKFLHVFFTSFWYIKGFTFQKGEIFWRHRWHLPVAGGTFLKRRRDFQKSWWGFHQKPASF